MRVRVRWLGAAFVALVAVGFAWDYTLRSTEPWNGVVLELNGRGYTRAEFEAYLGHSAEFPNFGAAESALQRFANQLMLESVADTQGIPVLQALNWLVEEAGGSDLVRESDIERYYREHRDEFRHPRRVTLSYAAVTRGADLEHARRAIGSVRVRAQLHPGPSEIGRWIPRDMHGAVAAVSEPVDCVESSAGQAHSLPAEVVRVGCQLRHGELSSPIETPGGFYIVKLRTVDPAVSHGPARVRSGIRDRLGNQARDRASAEAFARLQDRFRIEIPPRVWTELAAPETTIPTRVARSVPPRPPGLEVEAR